MPQLQMPNNTLFAVGIQQGLPGATDYIKMTLGYEQPVSKDDNFYYYSLTDLGMNPVKTQVPLQDEIGGRALTSGTYPTGVWAAGPVSLIPRLDNRLGWLLYAAMGDCSTIADTKAENLSIFGGVEGADSGIYSHIFQFQNSDQYFTPWLTIRELLPHSTSIYRVGQTFQDGKVGTLTLTGASGAPVTVDMALLARLYQSNYVFDYNPSWGTASYDDFDNFGVPSCAGHFRVGGTDFAVTAVSFTLTNNLLPPQQSMTIGSIHPRDFPNLGRTFTVTATFLVESWDLYVSTFAGASVSSTDSNAACAIYQADMDVMLASQTYISGTEPYRIRIASHPDFDNAAWSIAPLRVLPNQPLVLQATCTVQSTSTSYPVFVILQNDKANYTLPTPT